MTRVPVNEVWMAKRVLDAGSAGVMFPFTETPELARRAAASCKYPPQGVRGSGASLAAFRWPFEEYYDTADEEFLVVAVVEQASALDHVEEISATEGVDVIFIGTSDLSFSLGHRGRQDHPDVREAIERIRDAALKHGKWLGRPAFPRENIATYVEEGFQFFQADTDLGLMQDGADRLLESVGRKSHGDQLAI
jgi:2-keto-3-deoxy-L-rhamnonate aldolase RhmA